MPKQVIHPDDLPDIPDQAKNWLVAQGINISSKSPIGTLGLLKQELSNYFWDKYGIKPIYPGHGLFFDPEHPNWIQRLGVPLAASPTRTAIQASPAAFERVGGRPSSAHGFRSGKARTARGKCPKGHYWSYKEKKCLKSRFG